MHTLLKHVGVDVNVIIAGVKIEGIFSIDCEFQEIKNFAFLALQEGFMHFWIAHVAQPGYTGYLGWV